MKKSILMLTAFFMLGACSTVTPDVRDEFLERISEETIIDGYTVSASGMTLSKDGLTYYFSLATTSTNAKYIRDVGIFGLEYDFEVSYNTETSKWTIGAENDNFDESLALSIVGSYQSYTSTPAEYSYDFTADGKTLSYYVKIDDPFVVQATKYELVESSFAHNNNTATIRYNKEGSDSVYIVVTIDASKNTRSDAISIERKSS